jgi:hypothetical protein
MMDRGTVRKHVEFHSKNKFEKLVHLVGFIVGNSFIKSFCLSVHLSTCMN